MFQIPSKRYLSKKKKKKPLFMINIFYVDAEYAVHIQITVKLIRFKALRPFWI